MIKRFAGFSVAALVAMSFVGLAMDAYAVEDHPSFCTGLKTEWLSRKNASIDSIRAFRREVPVVCANLAGEVDQRISQVAARIAEQASRSEDLRVRAEKDAAARRELAALQKSVNDERLARVRAEREADNERRARQAAEAAAVIPGRAQKILACSSAQDLLHLDNGNMPNVKFENIVIPPEIQTVYDIADVDSGAIDVYGFDLQDRKWSRNRVNAVREGNTITTGSTQENQSNLRLKQRFTIDLDAMTTRGTGFVEAANLPTESAFNYDANSGRGNLNLGALMQRGPRAWLEVRGNCAYQNGGIPGPLSSTPDFRVTSREIPAIPPVPGTQRRKKS